MWWVWNRSRLARGLGDRYRPGRVSSDGVDVTSSLRDAGFDPKPYRVDLDAYRRYLDGADYSQYRAYYWWRKTPPEKQLEHFLAREFLALKPGEVYLDIASGVSPVVDIYHRLDGADTYSVDIRFSPRSTNPRQVHANAKALPWPDASVDAMALHCSFEHFEGDADSGFIKELDRVLKPGGRCVIVPFYLNSRFAIQSDPRCLPFAGLPWDDGADVYLPLDLGQRHGRFYDAERLASRVVAHLDRARMTLWEVTNPREVHPSCYAQYIGVFQVPAAQAP